MAPATVHLPDSNGPLLAEKLQAPAKEGPHHVQTTLTFVKENEDGSPQAPIYIGKPESYERPTVTIPATIHDISGHEHEYTLDSHGFQFYYHNSQVKEFTDDDKIRADYYPETEQLLKDVTGASRVFIYDHTIRRAAKDWTTKGQPRGPLKRVHIDSSYHGAKCKAWHYLPDEAPELLRGRYQMISVWRPIRTILKDPLALADAHSAPESGLFPVKFIAPDQEGEAWNVKADPNIKWYFRYKQTPNMVTLIKFYDSKVDGRARRVPHSAFVDPATEQEATRESIEMRALVFHPEDRD
ncbi:hypothetical protein X797_010571 [Metarhizium robertsii]|uniref:7alpha-cephem-methoxylase P8 chain related protein n=2 Tax=Metarhizium robertsii TaxID=568076 RepID=E9FC48_METRA|nr:7alpha-cephem-methoxylase P8 chain related protein [Metarhizium robertsii ARSEF 23]EFY94723.1 7alpha-cephem-methoxylase P8 chain related protein [Metarhizium robertsii ARSEF 23]EXU96310.1 hypothetical protein X797_010571 [Metarhizium robertsii]